MASSSDSRNPVEVLAEEFLERKRQGEQPTLREYLDRHPELADEIRELFPALLMIEDLGQSTGGTTGSPADQDGTAVAARLERLGDYRILREIGRGGMGVVYEAEQESLGRRVALKVLSAGALADPKQVRRFEREAKAAARLHHTNIVPVFGVGRQDGHHYFVMQFIAGLGLDVVLDDLRKLRLGKSEASPAAGPQVAASRSDGLTAADVARSLIAGRFGAEPPADGSVTQHCDDATPAPANGPPADPSSAVLPGTSALSSSDPDRQYYRSVARIGIQVAEALDYANRQGVLHRDVKPANLLLDNRGNAWVADFGLAKMADADDLTHTGDILGTIRYMAPERFRGKCDSRSDVYSLGLTLYELVALRPAYEAADRHALIERVLHEEPERLKRRAPSVPRDLETIIAKASARDPARRYVTAAALAEDLKRFVEDLPIRARRVSATERLARWCRRNKRLATAIGVAAATLVAAVIFSLLYAREQSGLAAARKLIVDEQSHRADDQAAAAASYKAALSESNRRLAMLNFERGRSAFDQGHIGAGMLWTIDSLRSAIEAGADNWKRVALANLAAWRRELAELKGVFPHDGQVYSVAFSPDGKTILTGSSDHTARLWDAATGRPIGPPLDHRDWVHAVAFSPDGKTILTGCRDKTARRWDAVTGRPIGPPMVHPDEVLSVAFSPDSKFFLTGSWDKTVRLWDAASGRSVGHALPHPRAIKSVAFSPDGKAILTACQDGMARLWDAATGRYVGQPIKHPGPVTMWGVYLATFSPDGKTIVTGGEDGTARLWDAATGQAVGRPMAHSAPVSSVAVSPDSKVILTGSGDNTAQLWDAATGQRIGRAFEHQLPVNSVAFSPDGKNILTGCSDSKARLWDGDVGRPVGRLLDYGSQILQSVAFGHEGKTLLAAGWDGRVRLWEFESDRLLDLPVKLGSHIFGIALSPDGKTILTGGDDNMARQFDLATGRPLGPILNHAGAVNGVAFSPDGKTILTGSADQRARLWNAATGRQLGLPLEHREWVMAVAFSPDGKTVLTGSRDWTARRWDAATGRPIGPPMQHRDHVWAVAFSPDGKTVLTGSADRTAQLWDAATGQPIGHALVSSWPVWSVAFSPDGKTVLTGSADRTAQLWDAATGQPIGAPMQHPSSGSGGMIVAFSPDGRLLLTADPNPPSTIRLWDAPVPLPDDPHRLAAWVEAATGLELDEWGSIRVLDGGAWQERRRRLEQLGGPPPPDPAPRPDPILFGAHPEARGDALAARGLWDKAEAAYAEAVRVRPRHASFYSRSSWADLTRFYISRGRPERAASALGAAVSRWPDCLALRMWQCAALLAAGDRIGWERAIAGLLDRFHEPMTSEESNEVAWQCSLAPYTVADRKSPVRLAESALLRLDRKNPDFSSSLNTLGAALYRAGCFEEAIRRLEEAIQIRGGEHPGDWPFLAMAHHRLGHGAEARRWLELLLTYQPSEDAAQFGEELLIRLLRSESEAVVLYDPIFPEDPFAR
jgi:WD40 repeat protein